MPNKKHYGDHINHPVMTDQRRLSAHTVHLRTESRAIKTFPICLPYNAYNVTIKFRCEQDSKGLHIDFLTLFFEFACKSKQASAAGSMEGSYWSRRTFPPDRSSSCGPIRCPSADVEVMTNFRSERGATRQNRPCSVPMTMVLPDSASWLLLYSPAQSECSPVTTVVNPARLGEAPSCVRLLLLLLLLLLLI